MNTFPEAQIVNAKEGIVKTTPFKTKVGIVAAGRGRNKAPYKDASWEFWGINEIPQERAERWFEMHPMEVQNSYELEWLKTCEKPVYLLELSKHVPQGVRYPIETILLSVAGARDYFTSTFAFQVALAIYEDYAEIGLWGLPLFNGSPREQTVERMCLEWWLGLAEGKGIRITTQPEDKLMYHPHRYGYDYYEEKRLIEGTMAHLGREIHTKQRHLNEDGGGPKCVGGDNWGYV